MSYAQTFLKNHTDLDAVDIMDKLTDMADVGDARVNHDWEKGRTCWVFPDNSAIAADGPLLMQIELTDEMIEELVSLVTTDDAGRHFTSWSRYYDELELLGFVKIQRPVHYPSKIPYDQQYWSIEITEEGLQV